MLKLLKTIKQQKETRSLGIKWNLNFKVFVMEHDGCSMDRDSCSETSMIYKKTNKHLGDIVDPSSRHPLETVTLTSIYWSE